MSSNKDTVNTDNVSVLKLGNSTNGDNTSVQKLELDTITNGETADAESTLPLRQLDIKCNGDLDGYQFYVFKENFISRDKLPRGSQTFEQVLREITDELEAAGVSMEQPTELKPLRRKTDPKVRALNYSRISRRRSVYWSSSSCSSLNVSTPAATFRRRIYSDGPTLLGNTYRKSGI